MHEEVLINYKYLSVEIHEEANYMNNNLLHADIKEIID